MEFDLVDAMRLLEELSTSQWGMVTTAQAVAHGVPRLDLSRLCQSGHLERLAHGVYRDAGAPSEEFESLRAAWLAADPSHTAEQRLRDLSGGVVVMGASAASLHGVGDLPADRHEFSAPAPPCTVAAVHDSGPSTGRTARLRRWFPRADVVLFGHSHAPWHERDVDDRGHVQHHVNPGSAVQRRREPHCTVAWLSLVDGSVAEVRHEVVG